MLYVCVSPRIGEVLFGKALQLQLASGGVKMHRFHQGMIVLRKTRFQSSSLMVLQESCEVYLVRMLVNTNPRISSWLVAFGVNTFALTQTINGPFQSPTNIEKELIDLNFSCCDEFSAGKLPGWNSANFSFRVVTVQGVPKKLKISSSDNINLRNT